MPDELRKGMVQFEVERGNYLSALAYMAPSDRSVFPVSYAGALRGLGMTAENVDAVLKPLVAKPETMTPVDRFRVGKIYYQLGECIEALKAFKPLKNKLPLDMKQEWAFYRANCFIKLGSKKRAAQVLSDILNGPWISNAYYNLAIAYNDSSISKTKALVALRVASTLNDGSTPAQRELNDRIYFAAGAIYLNEGKADLAEQFFKKIHLESSSAPQGLYMHGVTKLEQKDFRAATQSWFSAKKYATIRSGVGESMLAIPYAYEGAGYTSQALEAYLEASNTFEKELATIDKIIGSVKRYGVRRVLIEEHKLEGLEWFLAKDVAKNTQRAAYYGYLTSDPELYLLIEQLLELKKFQENLEVWQSQLNVYKKSINAKSKGFKASSQRLSLSKVQGQISTLRKKAKSNVFANADSVTLTEINAAIELLSNRLEGTRKNVRQGRDKLSKQKGTVEKLAKATQEELRNIKSLIDQYDELVTEAALSKFELLKLDIRSKFERAEQGLVHILESVAESRTAPRNRLDGRYQ